MPAYNFMARWEPKLLAGEKTTTIRADRKDGRVPTVGEPFSAFTGMRTKKCRRLFDSKVRKVSRIVLRVRRGRVHAFIRQDAKRGPLLSLSHVRLDAIAKADGFDDLASFFAFFLAKRRLKFSGHLIGFHPPEGKR